MKRALIIFAIVHIAGVAYSAAEKPKALKDTVTFNEEVNAQGQQVSWYEVNSSAHRMILTRTEKDAYSGGLILSDGVRIPLSAQQVKKQYQEYAQKIAKQAVQEGIL